MNDSAAYRRAKARVVALRAFYIHAAVYLLVNAVLLGIDVVTSPDSLWFYWPLLGWGVLLAAHALYTFGTGSWLGREWEERKVRELMSRDDRQ
jgi:hypothetical protein